LGRGAWVILAPLPESSKINSATSRTVYSMGLPMLTGRASPERIRQKAPSIRSSTYCRLLVWFPSP